MAGELTIREVRAADAERLLEIYAYYVAHTAISFEYDVPTPAVFRERMERITARYPYLTAERDGHFWAMPTPPPSLAGPPMAGPVS